MGMSSKFSAVSDIRGDAPGGYSYPFPNGLYFFPSSPVICKVGEDGMEGRTDEEDHSASLVHLKWHLDPSKSCTELEQDQDHVDKPKD